MSISLAQKLFKSGYGSLSFRYDRLKGIQCLEHVIALLGTRPDEACLVHLCLPPQHCIADTLWHIAFESTHSCGELVLQRRKVDFAAAERSRLSCNSPQDCVIANHPSLVSEWVYGNNDSAHFFRTDQNVAGTEEPFDNTIICHKYADFAFSNDCLNHLGPDCAVQSTVERARKPEVRIGVIRSVRLGKEPVVESILAISAFQRERRYRSFFRQPRETLHLNDRPTKPATLPLNAHIRFHHNRPSRN